MNILLIEDDLRVADLIKRGLEEQSFSLTLAYDGEMGLKLAISLFFLRLMVSICAKKSALKSQICLSLCLQLWALQTTK